MNVLKTAKASFSRSFFGISINGLNNFILENSEFFQEMSILLNHCLLSFLKKNFHVNHSFDDLIKLF